MYWPTFQKTLFMRMHTFLLVPSKAGRGFPWLPIYNSYTVIVSRDNHSVTKEVCMSPSTDITTQNRQTNQETH